MADSYRQACAELQTVWECTIASEDGPLPGSVLDSLITPQGWCGHVQLASAQTSARVMAAIDAIAKAYDLPAGSIVVRTLDDDSQAFIWAYSTKSGADYHLKWPYPVLDGSEFVDIKRESAGTTLLDLVQLTA